MVSKSQGHVTNEELAAGIDTLSRMVAEGFAQTATKDELRAVEDRLTHHISLVEKDARETNTRLSLVESKLDRALHKEIEQHDLRITRLEKKAGFVE